MTGRDAPPPDALIIVATAEFVVPKSMPTPISTTSVLASSWASSSAPRRGIRVVGIRGGGGGRHEEEEDVPIPPRLPLHALAVVVVVVVVFFFVVVGVVVVVGGGGTGSSARQRGKEEAAAIIVATNKRTGTGRRTETRTPGFPSPCSRRRR
jgi:hypothetical protein